MYVSYPATERPMDIDALEALITASAERWPENVIFMDDGTCLVQSPSCECSGVALSFACALCNGI